MVCAVILFILVVVLVYSYVVKRKRRKLYWNNAKPEKQSFSQTSTYQIVRGDFDSTATFDAVKDELGATGIYTAVAPKPKKRGTNKAELTVVGSDGRRHTLKRK